jgi:hypothetical protein
MTAASRQRRIGFSQVRDRYDLHGNRDHPILQQVRVLDPVEVESPYWKREWLVPDDSLCAVHDLPLVFLKAREVRAARNTPDLIARVGRQERAARRLH